MEHERPHHREQKKLTPAEARTRIYRYCAYQERSHQEVRNKLFSFGLRTDDVDEILAHLITEKFLNEERFAKAFAGGKFRQLKWGRIKIQRELERLGLSPRNIDRGLRELEGAEYSRTLKSIIQKKQRELGESDSFAVRNKVARFAISKGFEPELVWQYLKKEED